MFHASILVTSCYAVACIGLSVVRFRHFSALQALVLNADLTLPYMTEHWSFSVILYVNNVVMHPYNQSVNTTHVKSLLPLMQ